MIVFNLVAVPILLLVGALGAGLVWLMPGIFGGPYEEITYSVLAIGLGGLAEVVGLRGRLFFLPIWLIGGAVLAWQLWALFGTMGLVAGGGVLGLLLLAFIGTVAVALNGQEKQKAAKLDEARTMVARGEVAGARPVLADAWIIPMFGSVDAEGTKHLLAVLDVVDAHAAGLALPADGAHLARGCRVALERVAGGAKPIAIGSDEALLLHEMTNVLAEPTWTLKDDKRELLAKLG